MYLFKKILIVFNLTAATGLKKAGKGIGTQKKQKNILELISLFVNKEVTYLGINSMCGVSLM